MAARQPAAGPPDADTQCRQIRALWTADVNEGDIRYLVSKKWMDGWKDYVGYPDKYILRGLRGPGPVENSDLLDPVVPPSTVATANDALIADETGLFISLNAHKLKDGLREGIEYDHVSDKVWNLLVKWYGMTPDSRPIMRTVSSVRAVLIPEGDNYNITTKSDLNLHPAEFCLHQDPSSFYVKFAFSESNTVGFVERVVRIVFKIEEDMECDLWSCGRSHKLLRNSSDTLKSVAPDIVVQTNKKGRGVGRPPPETVNRISVRKNPFLEVVAVLRGDQRPQPASPKSQTSSSSHVKSGRQPEGEAVRQLRQQLTVARQELAQVQQQTTEAQQQTQQAQQRATRAERQIGQLQHQLETVQQQAEVRLREAQRNFEAIHQRANREMQRNVESAQQEAHQARQETQLARQQADQASREADAATQRARQQAEEARQQAEEAGQQAEEAQHRADDMEHALRDAERRITTSDQVFQDVLQRIMGHVPQSQPFWVVQRAEVTLTEEVIGVGGWASVKVATFRGQRVAAKCLHQQIVSAHNIRLFTREMNMAAQSRHPNLLQFVGAVMEGTPIILTELLPTSLRRVMEEGTRLTRQQIISISCDVARALNYLHLSTPDPIVHRDLSSANVLLDPQIDGWRAKVSDYGSANFVRYATTAGPGNPLYGAPEAGDPSRHSPKMDVFSFGVLLVEMFAGELPDNREELIRTRMNDWPELVRIVRGCTRREPQRRPDISELITDLTGLNVD